jgi:hypothetical protein
MSLNTIVAECQYFRLMVENSDFTICSKDSIPVSWVDVNVLTYDSTARHIIRTTKNGIMDSVMGHSLLSIDTNNIRKGVMAAVLRSLC